MSDVRGTVDVEAALVAYFNTISDVTDLVGNRISTDLPSKFGEQQTTVNTRLQILRSGGGEVNSFVDNPTVDIHCWGENWAKASLLCGKATLALRRLPFASLPGVVISDTVCNYGPIRLPDLDTDTPRLLMTWAMVTHLLPS